MKRLILVVNNQYQNIGSIYLSEMHFIIYKKDAEYFIKRAYTQGVPSISNKLILHYKTFDELLTSLNHRKRRYALISPTYTLWEDGEEREIDSWYEEQVIKRSHLLKYKKTI